MDRPDEQPLPGELREVEDLLRRERPRASDLELDRVKLRAITQASRARSRSAPRKLGLPRSRRLVSVALAVMLLGGGSAVLANNGGSVSASGNGSSANSQYCPPSSQQPGKPKDPGPSKCGKPKTK
jgi:hypothetical protein